MLAGFAAKTILRGHSGKLVVLTYHDIRDPMNFARQMDWLVTAMHPVSLDHILNSWQGSGTLPSNPVLVTFDDGYRSVYEYALPILRERAVPAVVFVIAGLLNTRQPFWWIEVEELVRRGVRLPVLLPDDPADCVRVLKRMPDTRRLKAIEDLRRLAPGDPIEMPQLLKSELRLLEDVGVAIGNHSLTHPVLDRCADEKIYEEINLAHEILREVLGKAPRAFAYPNGNFDMRAGSALRELDYQAAFLFDHRLSHFPPADRFQISRLRVSSGTPMRRFRNIVTGLHPAFHHAIGRS